MRMGLKSLVSMQNDMGTVIRTSRAARLDFGDGQVLWTPPENVNRQFEYQLTTEPFAFRPGAAFGTIPDSLQRIPSIFWPSTNLVE